MCPKTAKDPGKKRVKCRVKCRGTRQGIEGLKLGRMTDISSVGLKIKGRQYLQARRFVPG
jgi:hypothetical protein